MASGRCVMCLQCGFSFLRSTIFSSKCALAREAQTHCLLWITVCYLIRTETRCSGSQLCSDVILILTPQPCRIIILVSELGYHPAGLPEGSRILRSCLVLIFTARKHKAGLRCSFSTSYRNCDLDKSVWVRNMVKIATALSASNHEKECCCFTKAWLSVHSVGKICVVMLKGHVSQILIGIVLSWKCRWFFLCLWRLECCVLSSMGFGWRCRQQNYFRASSFHTLTHLIQSFSDSLSQAWSLLTLLA